MAHNAFVPFHSLQEICKLGYIDEDNRVLNTAPKIELFHNLMHMKSTIIDVSHINYSTNLELVIFPNTILGLCLQILYVL